MKKCFRCGTPWESSGLRPGREETCLSCGADLHVCRNCVAYDPCAAGTCREPRAEKVFEKEKRNFCEWFQFRETSSENFHGKTADENRKKQWDDLFSI